MPLKIFTDALTPISSQAVQRYSVGILPRKVQVGKKRLLLNQSSLLSSREVQDFFTRREGTILPFETDLALSALRKDTTEQVNILAILPSRALDSIYENVVITKGMLKGQRNLDVMSAPCVGVGLQIMVEAVAEFAATQPSKKVITAFAERLRGEINTALLVKGKLDLPGTSEDKISLKGLINRLFGSTRLYQVSRGGILQPIVKKQLENLGNQRGHEIRVEVPRGGEKFLQRFLSRNPGLSISTARVPLKPEKLSSARQVVLFYFLPDREKIQKIAAWARHWGQVINQE